jgi:hypothetical protein
MVAPCEAPSGRDRAARAARRDGVVRFRVGGETVVARSRGTVFEVARPDGGAVSVPAGAARDRHGNRNGAGVTLP